MNWMKSCFCFSALDLRARYSSFKAYLNGIVKEGSWKVFSDISYIAHVPIVVEINPCFSEKNFSSFCMFLESPHALWKGGGIEKEVERPFTPAVTLVSTPICKLIPLLDCSSRYFLERVKEHFAFKNGLYLHCSLMRILLKKFFKIPKRSTLNIKSLKKPYLV